MENHYNAHISEGAKLVLISSLFMAGCSYANSAKNASPIDKPSDMETSSIARACLEPKTLYFSCETSSGGHVWICGGNKSRPLDLTYRHDERGGIVFEHHWNPVSAPDGKFTQNAYHRYGTEYNEIGFALDDNEYRIFSHYSAEDGPEMFSRGVRIHNVKSGEEIRSLRCADTQVDEINQLIRILECDLDSALGCADSTDTLD